MKLVKNAGKPIPNLERSALSSDQIHNLENRYKRTRHDFEMWYVDWELLDAFKEVWTRNGHLDWINELRKSAKDITLTKRFYHEQATNENLEHYFDSSIERPDRRWNINFRVAHALLRKSMNIQKLVPITLSKSMDVSKIWTNKNASAGAIGRGTKEDNEELCLEAAFKLKTMIGDGVPFNEIWIPAVAFHRAQLSNLTTTEGNQTVYSGAAKMKDRFIWGLDGGTVTVEAQYAKPVIDHLKDNWFGYSGGDTPVQLRSKIKKAKRQKYWISADYSKFDQTVQSWVIEDAFSIIKEFYDPIYHKELDWICYNFINTWVCYSGGNLVQKHRGIPSGSNFTQVIGSMANALMMLTYLSSRAPGDSFNEKLSYVEKELNVASPVVGDSGELSMFVMGDDNLTMTYHKLDVMDLSKYVHRVFGTTIHPDKTVQGGVQDQPHYLKRDWLDHCEYRNPVEMAINVCHPERERTYDGYSCWHIMYGLFLTYSGSFDSSVSHDFFIKKMEEFGGIERLRSLKPSDLPGSLRALGHNAGEYLYHHAKAVLAEAS